MGDEAQFLFKIFPLLNYSKYSTIDHEIPKLSKFGDSGKELWYFAAKHDFDPTSPMLTQIKKTFLEFKPNLVILEGSIKINSGHEKRDDYFKQVLATATDQNVRQGGEFRFTLQLALQNNCEVFCPEPSEIDEITFLLTLFSSEQILTYKMIQGLVQWLAQIQTTEIIIFSAG